MNALVAAAIHGGQIPGEDRRVWQEVSSTESSNCLRVELRVAGANAASAFVVEKEKQSVFVTGEGNRPADVAAILVEANVIFRGLGGRSRVEVVFAVELVEFRGIAWCRTWC